MTKDNYYFVLFRDGSHMLCNSDRAIKNGDINKRAVQNIFEVQGDTTIEYLCGWIGDGYTVEATKIWCVTSQYL